MYRVLQKSDCGETPPAGECGLRSRLSGAVRPQVECNLTAEREAQARPVQNMKCSDSCTSLGAFAVLMMPKPCVFGPTVLL